MAARPKKGSSSSAQRLDVEKEQTYKLLAGVLQSAGIEVRREELKRGPGWKVVSGACRVFDKSVVFVDRKMTQDDQISFLAAKVADLHLAEGDERLLPLPESVRRLCVSQQS